MLVRPTSGRGLVRCMPASHTAPLHNKATTTVCGECMQNHRACLAHLMRTLRSRSASPHVHLATACKAGHTCGCGHAALVTACRSGDRMHVWSLHADLGIACRSGDRLHIWSPHADLVFTCTFGHCMQMWSPHADLVTACTSGPRMQIGSLHAERGLVLASRDLETCRWCHVYCQFVCAKVA